MLHKMMLPKPVGLQKQLHGGNSIRFGRPLLALVTASIILLFSAPAAFAAGEGGALQATALDVLCVEGLVIDHEEQPLRGWTVTATYAGGEGSFEPLQATSDRNGRFHFDLPAPGRWSFSIGIPEDWQPVTDASFEVNVTYGSTDCVNVRFKVEQFVTVIVVKIDDDHNPLAGWVIIATPGPGNLFAEEQRATTDENGVATFTLPPGNWIFSEEAPDDVEWWEPISPPDGVQEVDVTAPGPHTIRFKNRIKGGKGCIEVIKRDVPPESKGGTGESFGLPDWVIEVVRADGSIAAQGETDAFGRVTFSDLPFGPYTVREIMQAGWEPVTPTAYEVVLTRSDESCQVVEFYNKQVEKGFCMVGYKRDQNGLYGIPGWEIDAEPLGVNGVDPDPVLTDGTGKYRIDLPLDDYRIPGSSYQICEETRTGWTPVGPTCYTVQLPKYEGVCVVVPDFINRQTQRDDGTEKNGEENGDDEPVQPQPKHGHPKDKHHGGWDKGGHGACRVTHTVRRGESLSSVGRQYGVSVQELIWANPWVRKQRHLWLYTGQRLCIPG